MDVADTEAATELGGANEIGPAAAPPQNLVFVDLETTGGSPAYNRIIEVGLVRVANGKLIERWSTLVNPETSIPSNIQAFTGISNEMVRDAPRFADIAAEVFDKLTGSVFVAHNARFDHGFLHREFLRVNKQLAVAVLCTVKLSRRLFPQYIRHNLDSVMERHGITCAARHRALGDAVVLHDLWQKLEAQVAPQTLAAAAAQSMLGFPKLPAHLPPELADELPDGPGVYRYFGADDALLYVGRSNTLRARILAQLGAEHPAPRDRALASEVRRVDWCETAGELGSMLREAQLIRQGNPRHNRRRKDEAGSITLRPHADGSGRVEFPHVEDLEACELAQCFGVFRTEKDAAKALRDLACAHGLCLKVLGLEDAAGACLALQVGRCRGTCVGKEPLVLHDVRARMALSALKIKSWPFPSRIALREQSRDATELHVLDQWCYLGTARSEEELAQIACSATPGRAAAFDADVYKILVRYFATHGKLDWQELREQTLLT
jgi:DNA polymerase III subunit epsilon